MSTSVVTVWYRAPEILLGDTRYGYPIDIWAAGCILGELFNGAPIFRGKKESQLDVIVAQCGMIDEKVWPGVEDLPEYKDFKKRFDGFSPLPQNVLGEIYADYSSQGARNLLARLLELNPVKRPSAEMALEDEWFANDPKPQRINVDLLLGKSGRSESVVGKVGGNGSGISGISIGGGCGSSQNAVSISVGAEPLGKKRLISYDRNSDPKRPHTSSYAGSDYSSSNITSTSISGSSSRKSSSLKLAHHYGGSNSSNNNSGCGGNGSSSYRSSGSGYHSHHRK